MRGRLISVSVANPAPGADLRQAVPAGKRWRLISGEFQFTTSATAANRVVELLARDAGTNRVFRIGSNLAQAASLVWFYTFGSGLSAIGETATAGGGQVSLPCPVGLELGAGMDIGTNTVARQAADQFQACTLLVEEWDA